MSIPMDNHHELCHGDDCATWGCAELPENIGQYRKGVVTAVNADGSVAIEWDDGTIGTLQPKRVPARQAWEDSVRAGNRCSDPRCLCSTIPQS